MKKIILIIILIIALFFGLFYAYKKSVLNNMKAKQIKLESAWSEIYKNSTYRVKLLKQLTYPVPLYKFADSNILGLKMGISDLDSSFNSNECTLEFKEREYLINNVYLTLSAQNKADSFTDNNKQNIFLKLRDNDTLINNKIDYYNSVAFDYNKYVSLFPNFYFAKQKGYDRKKYFEMKYGSTNEAPNEQAKKFPEWAKGVDTTL